MINLAITLCVLWVITLWAGHVLSGGSSAISPYSPPKPESAAQIQPQADYSVLTRKNLFNPGAQFAPPVAGGEIIPCTLPLKLVGTIITENKKNNLAIIENTGDKQQDLYHVNDPITGGAVVAQVSRFEVIINNNGRLERLSIEFGSEGMPIAGAPGFAAAPRAPGEKVSMLGEGHFMMDRRFFESQKSNMNDMMTQIRAIPNMTREGTINGFQLFEITKDSMYDRIGLKNQDVLQRVNGQPLTSVEAGLDLFNALKNDNHFVLDVVRNNQRKTIKVDIQ